MKNIGISVVGFVTLCLISIIVLIIYVSLLGENNKIDSVIDNFFQNIQEQRYFSIEDNNNIVESFNVFDLDGEYSENCLLLELSLFEKYNIYDVSDYIIEIEKSHFWIPFIHNSNININISLIKTEHNKVIPLFKKSKKPEFVDNLFTVQRKDGRWLITAINIKNSSLFESVKRLRESLNLNSYVSFSGTKLIVKSIEIDTKNITNIERRKLNYIFQKLYQITETSENTTGKP